MDKFFDNYREIESAIKEMEEEIKNTAEARYLKWKSSREYLEVMRDIKERYLSWAGNGMTAKSLEKCLPDGCLGLFVKDMGLYRYKDSILYNNPDKSRVTTMGQLQSERWEKAWKTKKLKDFKSYWDVVI